MLKVRLTRTGKRGQPMYRIVVMEARSSRQGKIADTLGWYNPSQKDSPLSIDKTRYEEWLKKGAQPTDSVLRLVLSPKEKEQRWPAIKKKEEKTPEKS